MAKPRTMAVIMAGGNGERFWPASTPGRPKQFMDLTGTGTLIQQTVERVARVVPLPDIYVVTGEEHVDLAREQLPQLPPVNFIGEPAGRDTAPCIGLAAVWLERVDPNALMLVVPADHYIPDTERFAAAATAALEHAARTRGLITLGMRPDRPETGYGYIEPGEQVAGGPHSLFRVSRFVEKPDRTRAEAYLADGRYLWNSGIFAWPVSTIRSEIARYLPDLHAGLEQLAAAGDHRAMAERLPELFPRLPRTSIDYGVLERSDRVLVLPGDFRWDDLGSWTALARLHRPDPSGNVLRGRTLVEDCQNLVVESDSGLVALLGLKDLIVVQTGSVLLIASAERAQEVKRLAARARVAAGGGGTP